MTTLIPELPTPVPQSTDPVNFPARADAFLGALPGFATAANTQAEENNQAAAATAASRDAAASSASSAKNSSDLAAAAASAPRFDATATYAVGNLAWSPITGLAYRRLIAGKTAADPSADIVNWVEAMNLPVGHGPDQAPAGIHLGALAALDDVSSMQVQCHTPMSKPGDIWREYISDTQTVQKFHGFDGVIRTLATETWT